MAKAKDKLRRVRFPSFAVFTGSEVRNKGIRKCKAGG
jgi:hypothetical protein